MPTKRKKTVHAYEKYQSSRQPAKVREAAAELDLAAKARKKIGRLALGKPKSSKVHRDYVEVNGHYQAAGRRLAKLTGYKWKNKRK
jgi:hypothetical protein